MYEQFTERARNVMQRAPKEAMRFNHEYIGTEHILLGLIAQASGVAADVLKNLDIDVQKVRREIEKIVQAGADRMPLSHLPLTPRANKVLDFALDEARALGHSYVGTEHLLLGLIKEDEGLAAQVLMNLGLQLKAVRAEVLNLLRHSRETDDSTWDDEKGVEPAEVVDAAIQHLPASARAIVAEYDCQIDVVKEEKEKAVGVHAFEKAAELRDLEFKLRKLRDEFLSHWRRM